MQAPFLTLSFLGTVAFALATVLEPWFQNWAGNRAGSANVLQVALGDGRKVFARHFYAKADSYFHNGFAPTIFDHQEETPGTHMAGAARGHEACELENSFLGPPKDWIDRFSRNFYPARHTHLGDSGCGHSCCQRPAEGSASGKAGNPGSDHEDGHDCEHDHDCEHEAKPGGQEREILPWLRLSAELDPERIETYVVSAYWLSHVLGRVNEAEQFLREGLRANPGHHELLFELGRIFLEHRKDVERARNVWELALKRWREREAGTKEPNLFLHAQILGQLANLEHNAGRFAEAAAYWRELKPLSPYKESIQKWIEDAEAKAAAAGSR